MDSIIVDDYVKKIEESEKKSRKYEQISGICWNLLIIVIAVELIVLAVSLMIS